MSVDPDDFIASSDALVARADDFMSRIRNKCLTHPDDDDVPVIHTRAEAPAVLPVPPQPAALQKTVEARIEAQLAELVAQALPAALESALATCLPALRQSLHSALQHSLQQQLTQPLQRLLEQTRHNGPDQTVT